MKLISLLVTSMLIIFLFGCSPLGDGIPDGRLDPDLPGTWLRDDDSSGTITFGDELVTLYADGRMTYSDYLDPDGPGPEPEQWIMYSFGYEWTNEYYHDYSGNPGANNYISGSVLADDGSGIPFLLFQYRYNPHPDTIEVISVNSYQGVWTRQ